MQNRRSTVSRASSVYHHLTPPTLTSQAEVNQSALNNTTTALQRLFDYNPPNEDDGLPPLEPKTQDSFHATPKPPCQSAETKQRVARIVCALNSLLALLFLVLELFFLIASCFVKCELPKVLLRSLALMGIAAVLLEWSRTVIWRESRPTSVQRKPCHALRQGVNDQLEAQVHTLSGGNVSDCPISSPTVVSMTPYSLRPVCEEDCEYRGALVPQYSKGVVRFVLTLLLILLYLGGFGLLVWVLLLMDDCSAKSSLTTAHIYSNLALVALRLVSFGLTCLKLGLCCTRRRSHPEVPIVYTSPVKPPLLVSQVQRTNQDMLQATKLTDYLSSPS
ncbi:hypothetical protein SprV_0401586200 [Sparganum proliferum]